VGAVLQPVTALSSSGECPGMPPPGCSQYIVEQGTCDTLADSFGHETGDSTKGLEGQGGKHDEPACWPGQVGGLQLCLCQGVFRSVTQGLEAASPLVG
jgi:hypothetical protein